jgi:transcriptional regulator with XRE-family HTH domain
MAARETLPINPRLVEWARKRAGFTIQEASEKFARIAAWEAGQEFPTYHQIERLAEEFKLPVAVFFFPEPPQSPPIFPYVTRYGVRPNPAPGRVSPP